MSTNRIFITIETCLNYAYIKINILFTLGHNVSIFPMLQHCFQSILHEISKTLDWFRSEINIKKEKKKHSSQIFSMLKRIHENTECPKTWCTIVMELVLLLAAAHDYFCYCWRCHRHCCRCCCHCSSCAIKTNLAAHKNATVCLVVVVFFVVRLMSEKRERS